MVKDQDIDIIFTDYKMPEFNGLELLAAVKQYKPEIEVIMVTGYGSMESAIQAMKFGSYDYLQKPFKLDHLKLIIDRIIEEKKVKDKASLIRKRGAARHKFHGLVGISARMQQVYELIETVSRTNPMVLLQGESGTGKELVARTIHQQSDRRDNAFVPVNCGSVTEGVPEAEVLNHVTALMGKVHGGTIYLDEIAELAPALRLSILQALEADLQKKQSATRVIAATSKELGDVIASGALKKDFLRSAQRRGHPHAAPARTDRGFVPADPPFRPPGLYQAQPAHHRRLAGRPGYPHALSLARQPHPAAERHRAGPGPGGRGCHPARRPAGRNSDLFHHFENGLAGYDRRRPSHA
jgi:CheY-like chemotaxis protein